MHQIRIFVSHPYRSPPPRYSMCNSSPTFAVTVTDADCDLDVCPIDIEGMEFGSMNENDSTQRTISVSTCDSSQASKYSAVPIIHSGKLILFFLVKMFPMCPFWHLCYCSVFWSIYYFEFPPQLSANQLGIFFKLTNRIAWWQKIDTVPKKWDWPENMTIKKIHNFIPNRLRFRQTVWKSFIRIVQKMQIFL